MVLGITNPFFIKTFQNWPHIVRLGETKLAGREEPLFFCCPHPEVLMSHLHLLQVIYPNS